MDMNDVKFVVIFPFSEEYSKAYEYCTRQKYAISTLNLFGGETIIFFRSTEALEFATWVDSRFLMIFFDY